MLNNTIEKLFQDSRQKAKRAKILFYGSYGTGKTVLSLQFPSPVLIDMERGSDCYQNQFDFKVFHATDPTQVLKGVDYLLSHKTDRQTIVLDSMTEYWSSLQSKWTDIFLRRNKGKGNKEEFYDLQPKDWTIIKNDFKAFLRKLLSLDMNVVCTCRVKDQYAEGEFLKKVGETFDSDRSLPYLFDTVVRLDRTQDGKFMARVEKDRTNSLPQQKPFECNYLTFAAAFDLPGWDEILWPESWLWNGFKGKALSGKDFATDSDLASYAKDEKTYKGRQCLHIMAEKHEREEVRMIARKLLEKYPSQKKAKESIEIKSETSSANVDSPKLETQKA
jgi:hypothetical protein